MYDLLLKGGKVIDPSQHIHRKLDVAIKAGRIACLEADIAPSEAEKVINIENKILTAGLVDLHTHVYWGGTTIGVKPDEVARETGVTTFVDAGSAGAGNFLGFKEYIIDKSKTRIFAFLHISYPGLTATIYDPANFVILGETFDIRYAMINPTIEVGRAYPGLVKGIKVRASLEASGDQGVKPLVLALEAAEALGKPVMVHIGSPPPTRREVLPLLRKGDVLTHAFRGDLNSPLDRRGRLLPEMIEARERGVIIDLGHGGSSFSWAVAEKMLEQGFPPDTISSDIHLDHKIHTNWPGTPVFNMVTTMSKMLSLGMDLDNVILASTYNPAKAIGCQEVAGSVCEGNVADIAVFEIQEGRFEFSDWFCGKTVGNKRLKHVLTIIGGEILNGDTQGHRGQT